MKARLQSFCLPQSGAWLAAPPVPALGLHLSRSEFQVSVKYRIGIAVYEDERKSPYCKSGTLDIFSDHAVICRGRGDAISRHVRTRHRTASACSAANLSSVIEKRNPIARKSSRPGGIFLPPPQPNIINHAAEKSGYAIETAEEQKYANRKNSCSEQGYLFVPFEAESFGGLAVTLKRTLKRIAPLADSRNYQSQGHAIAFDRLAQSVSVVIPL